MDDWFVIQQVYAQSADAATVTTVSGHGVAIDAWALTALMILWILVICALTQMLKLAWLSYALEKGRRYRRVVPLLPPVVGCLTGLFMANDVALSLSFVVHWLAAALMLGPVAGMLAGWSWIFGRRIVMPAVLAVAPTATRRALVGLLARVGIDVSDVADVSIEISRAELGLADSSVVEDEAPEEH